MGCALPNLLPINNVASILTHQELHFWNGLCVKRYCSEATVGFTAVCTLLLYAYNQKVAVCISSKTYERFRMVQKSSGIFLSLLQCALRLHNTFIGLQWDAKPGFKFRPFLRNALRNVLKFWCCQGELGNKSIVILDNTNLLISKSWELQLRS